MIKNSSCIFRWLSEDKWQDWLCWDMRVILEVLSDQGVSILMVGEENCKSPEGVIFMDKPFDPNDLIPKLPDSVALNTKAFENGIMCMTHYVSIAFEQSLVKKL